MRWREFLDWFAEMRRKGKKTFVHNLVTTRWYFREEKASHLEYGVDYALTMWTQWWVKFADETGYFTVTPSLNDGKTLCGNWQEPGLHFKGTSRGTDAPIYRGSPDQFVWPEKLISLDWNGKPVPDNTSR